MQFVLVNMRNLQLQETEAQAQETKELVKSLEEKFRQKSEENTELRERCEKVFCLWYNYRCDIVNNSKCATKMAVYFVTNE